MPNGYVVYIHYSKRGAAKDRPWTVHYRGRCIEAAWVNIKVRSETCYKRDKRTNPKAFIRAYGTVRVTSKNNNIVVE